MKFYYKTLAFASLLALAACSDFDEMNTNPYEPPYSPGTSNTDVSPEGIDIDYELPEADIKALKEAETSIGSLFRNLTNEGPYNDYQVTTNLTHDIYAGYMANTSAVYARIDAKLKENAEAILAQLGITPSALIQMTYSQVVLHNGLPFSARIPAKAPTAVGRMTQEQLDAELRKGVESFNKGSFTTDEIDQALAKEFGI